jgi:hypothetical protein
MDQKFLHDGMSAMATGATTLTGWSLAILGATIAGIVAGDFLRPSAILRYVYLLFIPGWAFLGIAIWFGDKVNRRLAAAAFTEDHQTLRKIAGSMNSDYAAQRLWFEFALLTFGVWLSILLSWWVFAKFKLKSAT